MVVFNMVKVFCVTYHSVHQIDPCYNFICTICLIHDFKTTMKLVLTNLLLESMIIQDLYIFLIYLPKNLKFSLLICV